MDIQSFSNEKIVQLRNLSSLVYENKYRHVFNRQNFSLLSGRIFKGRVPNSFLKKTSKSLPSPSYENKASTCFILRSFHYDQDEFLCGMDTQHFSQEDYRSFTTTQLWTISSLICENKAKIFYCDQEKFLGDRYPLIFWRRQHNIYHRLVTNL